MAPFAMTSTAPTVSTPSFDLSTWSAQHLQRVEQALEQWIDPHAPANLGQAMRYAVLGAGKRLRP